MASVMFCDFYGGGLHLRTSPSCLLLLGFCVSIVLPAFHMWVNLNHISWSWQCQIHSLPRAHL